jgi:hypothetical protein
MRLYLTYYKDERLYCIVLNIINRIYIYTYKIVTSVIDFIILYN